MNPWFAKAVVLIASIVTVLIRAPHGKRSRIVKVAKSRKGRLEVALLTVVWIAFFAPIVWVATPWLAFADFPKGLYRHVRHPMYSALLLYGLGLALVVPNWVAGPSYAAAMVLVFALRLRPEEELMRDQFKGEYEVYASRTKRLVPGVW